MGIFDYYSRNNVHLRHPTRKMGHHKLDLLQYGIKIHFAT